MDQGPLGSQERPDTTHTQPQALRGLQSQVTNAVLNSRECGPAMRTMPDFAPIISLERQTSPVWASQHLLHTDKENEIHYKEAGL